MHDASSLSIYLAPGHLEAVLVRKHGGRTTRKHWRRHLRSDQHSEIRLHGSQLLQNILQLYSGDSFVITWVLGGAYITSYHHQVEHINTDSFVLTQKLQKAMLQQVTHQAKSGLDGDHWVLLPSYHMQAISNGYSREVPVGTSLKHYALDCTLYAGDQNILIELANLSERQQVHQVSYTASQHIFRELAEQRSRFLCLLEIGLQKTDILFVRQGDLLGHRHVGLGARDIDRFLSQYARTPGGATYLWEYELLQQQIPAGDSLIQQTELAAWVLRSVGELSQEFGTPTEAFLASPFLEIVAPVYTQVVQSLWSQMPPVGYDVSIETLLEEACAQALV